MAKHTSTYSLSEARVFVRGGTKLHKITDIPMCLSVDFFDDSENRCIINLDM
jgi:hypothetical protein